MLISMTEKRKKAIDNGRTVGAVFIDFQKTFDTVPHDIFERFSIAFTANGKRQAEIFSLMENNEAFFGLSLSPPSRRQLSNKYEKERSEYKKHKFMHFRTNSALTFPVWR